MSETLNFDAPDLAARIEQLSQYELDHLPFGVILLNREDIVLFYSETEARQSGYGKIPIGQNLFALSPCMASDDFQGRIRRAIEAGPVDLKFGGVGDFADPQRKMRFRIQTSRANGIWIFVQRDNDGGVPRAPS